MSHYFAGKYNTWVVSVIVSLWKLLLALLYARAHYPNYFVNLFYYTDILMNSLVGGHPYVTISARVGKYSEYYREREESFTRWFWLTCERIINFAFIPLDGEGHCAQATVWAETVLKDELGRPIHIQHGPAIFFVPMLFIVVIACMLLVPINYGSVKIGLMKKNVPFDPEAYEREQALMRL